MQAHTDDHPFSLEHEMAIDAAGSQTFWRCKQLTQHGYKLNLEYSDESAFWFEHPRRSFQHHTVALYSSGLVRSMFAPDDLFIERWDQERFKSFVRDVPYPNWWERGREFRQKLWGAVFLVVLYAMLLLGVQYLTSGLK